MSISRAPCQIILSWILCAVCFTMNAHAEPPETVAQATVAYFDIPREKIFDGVVEAVHHATITAQTSGQIIDVYFDVDDFVPQGAVLAKIAAVEQKALSAEVQAKIVEAQAYYQSALADYNRTKTMFDKQAIAATAMDKAKADLAAAQARLNAAKAASTRTSTQEDYTQVVAPYSGVVVERHIQPGEVAQIGTPIMSGVSLDQLRVVVFVPQTQVEAVRAYHQARILLPFTEGMRIFPAQKITISPQADSKTHSFKVRVDVSEGQTELLPGMNAKVVFHVGSQQRLMIPAHSVARRGEVRSVYTWNAQGQLQMRTVRLGEQIGELVEVLAGLQVGQVIAADPIAATVALKKQRAQQPVASNEGAGH